MIQKRINTDLFLRLSVVSKDGSPVDLENVINRKVVVWNADRKHICSKQAFSVVKNVVSFQYSSEENTELGPFGVTIYWSKKDTVSETGRRDYAVDFLNAFTVVEYSTEEDSSTIEYTGEVSEGGSGGGGIVDLSNYYNKQEINDKLKNKVSTESGKGLSSNDYTTEEKTKLAGLSNYDDTDIKKSIAGKASKEDVYTKKEVDSKILSSSSITSSIEQEVGVLRWKGSEYTVFSRTLELPELPTTLGGKKDYIIDADPLGNNIYLKADNLIVVGSDGSYYPSSFSVSKMFISLDDFQTHVEISNNQEISDITVSGMVTISYIKHQGKKFRLSLSVPEGTSLDSVSVDFAPLKYNKKMAYSFIAADGNNKPYSKLFKYIQGKWVNDGDAWHPNMGKLEGFQAPRTLTYTDGCGIVRRFTMGNSIIPIRDRQNAEYPYDTINPTANFPYLVWDEIREMLDFDGSVQWHNVKEIGNYNPTGNAYDKTDPEQVLQGLKDVQAYVKERIGRGMSVLAIPDGNAAYGTAGLEYDEVLMMTGGKNNSVQDVNLITAPLYKLWRGITISDDLQVYKNGFDKQYSLSGSDYAGWVLDVTHNVGVDVENDPRIQMQNYVYDNHGKESLDDVWVATPDEIYMYKYLCSKALVSKKINNGILDIDVMYPLDANVYWEEFTFLIGGISPQGVSLSGVSDNVVGASSGVNGDKYMVNINMMNSLIERSERYTAKYESSLSEEDKNDALYFVNRLKPALKQPYIDRIMSGEEAPNLISIVINSGASTTSNSEVSVSLSVVGNISHYKISENQNFVGSDWIEGSSKNISYALSSGFGAKTIYVQVKNQFGESEVKSSSIMYEDKPVVLKYRITGQSNNVDFGTVTPAVQDVLEGSTAELTAQAKDGYLIDSWTGATSSTGIGMDSGAAKVENVRSEATVICNFKEKAVTPDSTGVVISLGWDHTAGVPSDSSGYREDLKATVVRVNKDLVDLPIYDKNGNEFGKMDLSGLTVEGASYIGNVTGDNSGIYPDVMLKSSVRKPNGVEIGNIALHIPDGLYKFKIFMNTKRTTDMTKTSYLLHSGSESQLFALKSNYVDNFNDVSELTMSVVGGLIELTMSSSNTRDNIVFINVVEIEKVNSL